MSPHPREPMHRMERDRCADHAQDFQTCPAQLLITHAQEPRNRALPPLAQQLDLDGEAHDLAPQTRQEKLFEPAPFAQLDGQQHLPTNEGDA